MAAAALREQTVDFPATVFSDVTPRGLGIDIGGTLIKVAHASRPDPDTIRVHMYFFHKDDIQHALHVVKDRAHDVITPGQEIFTTGVGCNKFGGLINDTLNVKIKNVIEMECNSLAMKVLSKNLPQEEFVFPPSEKAEPFIKQYLDAMSQMDEQFASENTGNSTMGALPVGDDSDTTEAIGEDSYFPCMGCFMGSGAFYAVINKDGSYNFIDVNTSCGRMLSGLGSLLTGAKSFEELIGLAEKGDISNVDLMVKHVTDAGGADLYSLLPPDMTIYCFGNTQGKSIGDFRREDLALALVSQLASSIAQACNLAMVNSKVRTLFFGGSLCAESELVRTEITKHAGPRALTTMSGKPWKYYFLRHGSYIGALGALLLAAQITK